MHMRFDTIPDSHTENKKEDTLCQCACGIKPVWVVRKERVFFPTKSRKTDRRQTSLRQKSEELLIEGRRTFGSKQNTFKSHFRVPHALLSVHQKAASSCGTGIGIAVTSGSRP